MIKIPHRQKLCQTSKTKAYFALSKFSKIVLYSKKPTKHKFTCLSWKTATLFLCVLAGQSCDWLLFGFHPEVRAILKLRWLFNDESCVYRSVSLRCWSLLLLFPSESYLAFFNHRSRCWVQPIPTDADCNKNMMHVTLWCETEQSEPLHY